MRKRAREPVERAAAQTTRSVTWPSSPTKPDEAPSILGVESNMANVSRGRAQQVHGPPSRLSSSLDDDVGQHAVSAGDLSVDGEGIEARFDLAELAQASMACRSKGSQMAAPASPRRP